MMDYLRKIPSLEERASAQVAINLCQDNGFKELAMRLEKPTYGAFISEFESFFATDTEELSRWSKMKDTKVKPAVQGILSSLMKVDIGALLKERWVAAIDEQCQMLTEGLPHFLKHRIHFWIKRIALEYLSYGRRQEQLFGVSRYFLMDILSRGDWTESLRLDEKKIAERLVRDNRLTVLQRYRIACVNFLEVPHLWKRLTQLEKNWVNGNLNRRYSQEKLNLVFFSSCLMSEQWDEKILGGKNRLWVYTIQPAIFYGNRATLMACWKRLKEHQRKQMVIVAALQSLHLWKCLQYSNWREELISIGLYDKESTPLTRSFCLPFYYSELMCFFLSEMDEEQQLTFLNRAFQFSYNHSVLECFLDWPHQDNFLPTINRLWGIIPKDKYALCLLTLASKYSGNENRYYDYRSLLWTLWENTPEAYKQYVFHKNMKNTGMIFLHRLLEKSPFQEKDEILFKRVFCHQPLKERRAMMHYKVGESICSKLVQNENWSFVNWLLEECLPKEEIPCYKKQFIQLDCCDKPCCSTFKKNVNWVDECCIDHYTLSAKIMQGNCKSVRGTIFSQCEILLSKGNFTGVERIISFCLSADEIKEHVKVHFAMCTCAALLKKEMGEEGCVKTEDFVSVWEQMNAILAWSVDADEKIRNLKKDLFSREGINAHFKLLFLEKQFEEVEYFYKWFGLSPEEVKKLKKDTIFTPKVFQYIERKLYVSTDMLVAPLCWCLTDQEMVIDLKKKVEEVYFERLLDSKEIKAKEQLDYLVSELLCCFKKEEFQNKANRESGFMQEKKGEKRPSIAKEESGYGRKRFK